MKTNELTGAALNWAVAKCEGVALVDGCIFTKDPDDEQVLYSPSTHWGTGGPIIEREKISLIWMQFSDEQYWLASIDKVRHEHEMFDGIDIPYEHEMRGANPLEVAMRCYVLSKLGDEVQIPEGVK